MITFTRGDIFNTMCEAIVNPCNCVGVAGKGISLHLRNMAPNHFDQYRALCKQGHIRPGKATFCPTHELGDSIKYIVDFPTKDHWKNASELIYIRDGMCDLLNMMKNFDIKSVAIPALGCGCGGLNWEDVKKAIILACDYIGHDGLEIRIYEPI